MWRCVCLGEGVTWEGTVQVLESPSTCNMFMERCDGG